MTQIYINQKASTDNEFKVQGSFDINSSKLAQLNPKFNRDLTSYRTEMCREANRALFNHDQDKNCSNQNPTIYLPSLDYLISTIEHSNDTIDSAKLLRTEIFDLFRFLTEMLTSFTSGMIDLVDDDKFKQGSKSRLKSIRFELDDVKSSFFNPLSVFDFSNPDQKRNNDIDTKYSFTQKDTKTVFEIHYTEDSTELKIIDPKSNKSVQFSFNDEDKGLDECHLKQEDGGIIETCFRKGQRTD